MIEILHNLFQRDIEKLKTMIEILHNLFQRDIEKLKTIL